ncbi:MAG: PSD1 and planctomycete cytochrome C domain-containing protein [Verrucomicrobiota bacterium]
MRGLRAMAIVIPALLGIGSLSGNEPSAEAGAFFESKIRPLLSKHCFECHGKEKQKGDLRLDSLAALLRGGEQGPAVVPGDPGHSLLMEAVRYSNADLQMPPKTRLGQRQVALLERWISLGAPWPGQAGSPGGLEAREEGFEITEEDRAFWAFQPLNPGKAKHLDAIVNDGLTGKRLVANGPADARTLIRRVYYDLIGLPPTYAEVQHFLKDSSDEAYARLVDRLLARPEYGERWGRHWLDVVRYAQTNGYERDDEKPFSWRYRDYVIEAFNEDKPYDRFILEQLAGDELPDAGEEGLIATGFYRLGVYDDEPDDKRAAEFDGLDDILKTTTETFIGLTGGCARCHDHMFDPVSQNDYYHLLAFFRNVTPYNRKVDRILAVSESGPTPKPTHVLVRGNAGRPGQEVEPRFPAIFGGQTPEINALEKSTGRRLALARWIADPDHPLTARVMVNRVWQYHFGSGLVKTPNDFGNSGEVPENVTLVDWLADVFVKSGWSVKHLHRVIMNSDVYRRSSASRPWNEAIDPGNRYWWRQQLRRLEAEAIRDSILHVAGELSSRRGGDRGFYPVLSGEVVAGASRPGRGWGWSSSEDRKRRSVYAFVKRTMVYPFFEIFDYANTEGSLGQRPSTTVAPQALLLLNGELVGEHAAIIARGLGNASEDVVGEAFRRILSRDPDDEERAMAAKFLQRQEVRHEKTEGHLVVTSDFPPALFQDYQKALPADRFLRGPEMGWQYYKGRWDGSYEGIVNSVDDFTPLALYRQTARDLALAASLSVDATTSRVGFWLRARSRGEEAEGYELLLDVEGSTMAIRRHRGGRVETLAEKPVSLDPGQTLSVEVGAEENGIRFLAGEQMVECLDEGPDRWKGGQFGLFVRGGALSLTPARLVADGVAISLIEEKSDGAQLRAREDFCALLLNLNEFVYID